MAETCVLAYSGGLDTSVAVAWIRETHGYEVVTCTVDLGNVPDLAAVQQKAIASGAKKAVVVDARDVFVRFFVWPALQAGALYQDKYPLATALGRPLIAKLLVDAAREEGARFVAHGSTGKGNDQVRFDLAVHALAPDLTVIAPLRGGMNMSREEEIAYAKERGIPVPVTEQSPYSVDENLWGRSIEAGVLEDAWQEPPRDVFQWTVDPNEAPELPASVVIGFEQGVPASLDGKTLEGVALIQRLNALAGQHGVGRVDLVEDRLVGIKSREIYEAPAAVTLHAAHTALEEMVLTRDVQRTKRQMAQEYARVVYEGLWFSAHHQDLAAYVRSTQRFVSGEVKVRLHRGTCTVVGRKSQNALYQVALATYSKEDRFDHQAAEGFIAVFGLPLRTQARVQELWSGDAAAALELERKAIESPQAASPKAIAPPKTASSKPASAKTASAKTVPAKTASAKSAAKPALSKPSSKTVSAEADATKRLLPKAVSAKPRARKNSGRPPSSKAMRTNSGSPPSPKAVRRSSGSPPSPKAGSNPGSPPSPKAVRRNPGSAPNNARRPKDTK